MGTHLVTIDKIGARTVLVSGIATLNVFIALSTITPSYFHSCNQRERLASQWHLCDETISGLEVTLAAQAETFTCQI